MLKWKYFELGEDDAAAKKHVLENISMGAMEHTLSKKLLARFSTATGPFVLIAFDTLDIRSRTEYEHGGAYSGGKDVHSALGAERPRQEDSPMGGIVASVQEHLRSSTDAVLLCENWIATRQSINSAILMYGPRESHVVFYGEDVYHIVTSTKASYDQIECTIRESRDRWATGVCSRAADVPKSEILSEKFLDGIVLNITRIIVPALDNEGFLVWSPRL